MGSVCALRTHPLPQDQSPHLLTALPLRDFYRMHLVKCFRGWRGLRVEHLKKCLGKDSGNFNSLNKLGLNFILTNMAENSVSFLPPTHIPQIFISNKHVQVQSSFLKNGAPKGKKNQGHLDFTWEVENKSIVG